ncbi:MAG: hypothetical protein NTY89_08830 [Nostocales cyanobacterium LacPavin_0920_SED1_MAG_38_18]|nr:hypothetical protein [Nostocales cyanobacterium LacPavin_0920_SED1_MAG_38_18]
MSNNEPLPAEFRKTGIALPPPQNFNPKISDRINVTILQGLRGRSNREQKNSCLKT